MPFPWDAAPSCGCCLRDLGETCVVLRVPTPAGEAVKLPMCSDCWCHMRQLLHRELSDESVSVVLYGPWPASIRTL